MFLGGVNNSFNPGLWLFGFSPFHEVKNFEFIFYSRKKSRHALVCNENISFRKQSHHKMVYTENIFLRTTLLKIFVPNFCLMKFVPIKIHNWKQNIFALFFIQSACAKTHIVVNGSRIKVVAQALIKCTELKSTHQAEQKLF